MIFIMKLKKRSNFFELPSSYEKTESELLNNSIFSKTWYLYNQEIYYQESYFIEHGVHAKKYDNQNCKLDEKIAMDEHNKKVLDFITNDFESDYLGTYQMPTDYYDCIAQEFIDCLDNWIDLTDEDAKKFKSYLELNNALVVEDYGSYIDADAFILLLTNDWKCFLYYKYFDGQHNTYWLINTNKSSPLFEYVFVYGIEDFMFFHFSEMDEKMQCIKQICQDFDLFE